MYAARELRPRFEMGDGPEALKATAAEINTIEGRYLGWRESLIRGQQKVAEHYRNVLAKHQLSQRERDDILSRIARVEAELDALTSADDKPMIFASEIRGS